MGWVNDFIKPTGYVAGTDHLTVADLCFVATYATIEACGKFDLAPYAETNAWFEKMKTEIPNYEKANGEGATAFGGCLIWKTFIFQICKQPRRLDDENLKNESFPNKTSYSSFWSVEATDFKNVILDKIRWAASEAAEV